MSQFISGPSLPPALIALAAQSLISPDNPVVLKASGYIEPRPEHLDYALRAGLVGRVRWDDFTDTEIVEKIDGRVPLDKPMMTRLTIELGNLGFRNIPPSRLRDALHLVAKDDAFDSAIDWLVNLPAWDGVERVERFLPDYLGTKSGRYELAVARYWWTAMAARILQPGCQADMVPVLVGPQRSGKSKLLSAMVPSPDLCGEACITDKGSDLARKVQGKFVIEWAYMRGIKGGNDADEAKAFITCPYVEVRSQAQISMTRLPRRFILAGTTSKRDFLRDPTGHRRYLPFDVAEKIDIAKVVSDRDQLWAEALHLVRARLADGSTLVDYEDAERLAANEHENYTREAAWVGDNKLIGWLNNAPDRFSTDDALEVVRWVGSNRQGAKRDMAETLRQLGCTSRRTRVDGMPNPQKRWCKP